ncbi:MAG: AsnC family transcriptional regulator [archaeon]
MSEAIKLDVIDKKILTQLDINCRIPSTKLAKIINKSRQTVDYRISNLQKQGIITSFTTSINPHKIGYKLYKVYLKLKNIPLIKTSLLNHLKSSGIVYWIGECSGRYDLIFATFSKDDKTFVDFKNNLISEYKEIIVDLKGDILVYVKQYPKMYFLNKIQQSTYFAGEIVNNKIDEIDEQILEKIINNARESIYKLSIDIGVSPAAIKSHMKKMQELGIIIQYRISVDLNKLNLELYKAIITLERFNSEDEKQLIRYLSNIPNIIYYIKNMWQLEIEFIVNNYQEYYKILEELKKNFTNIINTVDFVLMITDEWTPGYKNLLKLELPKNNIG